MDEIWTMTVRIRREAVADRLMVRHAFSVLFGPGEWYELRALPSGRGQVVQVDDLDAAFAAVESLADEQVYYCLNPIAPDCKRANTKVVLSRRWLLIDVDAVKTKEVPRETSSTEEEKVRAATVAGAVLEYLSAQGWPAPIMIDSGNGWHLLYRIDLPNDKLSQQILKGALYALAEKFTSDSGIIDRSTHDAPRISKLPGTMARKGPDTPDRPHRMCRIVYEPEQLEVVPVELLQKLGSAPQEKPAERNGKHDPWTSVVSVGSGLAAYLKRAIESECLRVALAVADRNIQLNKSAFALGQLAGWPEMNEREAKATLQLAAERAGLLDREIIKTIASGWEAGSREPRVRPQEPVKTANKPAIPAGMLVSFGHETQCKTVDWLWQDRIAIGFISIFAGKTGIGKSFVLCDVVACLTTGRPLPNQQVAGPITRVLMISEDPKEYVLVPRLMELGADLRLVAFMTWEAMAAYTLGNIDMLEQAYLQAKQPTLIIIDPPANFLGKKDQHKDAEVRSLVMRLVAWLDTKRVASVFVTHINKQIGKMVEALDRIMGSVAWGTTSRVAVGFAPDPNTPTQCLCVGIKNNLGEKASSLVYEIVKTSSLARVEWKGKSDVSADDAMNQTKKKSRGECAVEWLTERFREKREWESDELKKMAFQEGFSKNALWAPEVNALPIKKKRRMNADGEPYYVWRADDGWPPPEKNAGKVGKVGNPETQAF